MCLDLVLQSQFFLFFLFYLSCVWILFQNDSIVSDFFFFSICETVYCMQRGSRPLLAASKRRFPSGGVSLAG